MSRDPDSVNQGFHSYGTIDGAREDVIYQQEREKSNELPIMNEYQIVQCVIPKGAEYYEGTFAEWESYASNQIKIIGEIDL